MSRKSRIAGIALLAVCRISICAAVLVFWRNAAMPQRSIGNEQTFSAWETLQNIPESIWKTMLPTALTVGALLTIFSAVAIYLSATGRRRLAATMIAAAMIPTGLGMIDGVARMA